MPDLPSAPLSDGAQRLYGRDAEIERLGGWLREAVAGRTRLILIGGEGGIGKSMLVRALCDRAARSGASTLSGSCYDLAATPPYGPWLQIFESYVSGPGMPAIPASLVNPDLTDSLPGRDALFSEATMFLAALAARRPLVLVLEDLHWADEPSMELLRYVARALGSARLLVVATYRDAEPHTDDRLAAFIPQLVREGHAERMTLRRLATDAIARIVADSYRLPVVQQRALTGWLDRRSEGNPFFLRELLHTLEHDELLRPGDEGWSLGSLDAAQVPVLVRQLIDRRLTWLAPSTRRLLEAAAVVGNEVPYALWSAVAAADDDDLALAIEQAVEARLIEESASRDGYRFCHALIRDVLYHGTVIPRRRGWHRRIAERSADEPDVDPDVVAFHYQQARDPRAAYWLTLAGDRAIRTFAYVAAAQRFEQALALLSHDRGSTRERIELLCALGQTYAFPDAERALHYLDQAAALLETAGDDALEIAVGYGRARVRALLGEPSLDDFRAVVARLEELAPGARERLRRPLLWPDDGILAQFFVRHGDYVEATRLAQRQLGRAPGTGAAEQSANCYAYYALGLAQAGIGQRDTAREAFRHGREIARSQRDHHLLGMLLNWEAMELVLAYAADDPQSRRRLVDEAVSAWEHVELSVMRPDMAVYAVLLLDGRWTEARDAALVDITIGSLRFDALRALCDLAVKQGETQQALDYLYRALPDGWDTMPGSNYYFYSSLWLFRLGATLAIGAGDVVTAHHWLDAHDRWLDGSERILDRPASLVLRASAHALAGDQLAAQAAAERALELATAPRQPLALLAAHRILGELDTAEGRLERAAQHLGEAMAIAERCSAPYERALTLVALAGLATETSDIAAARGYVAEVRRIAGPLGAQPLIDRVDVLTRRHDDVARRSSDFPLSAREVEVLRLVARGMSNNEVGELLFISPRTVAQHLQSIYNKLGISSRTAAAAYAFEHDLTEPEPRAG